VRSGKCIKKLQRNLLYIALGYKWTRTGTLFCHQYHLWLSVDSLIIQTLALRDPLTCAIEFEVYVTVHHYYNRSAAGRCIVPNLYIQLNCSWGWAKTSAETCRTDFKQINKRKLLHLLTYLHRCAIECLKKVRNCIGQIK
jgi:hypothetical protein